MVIVENLCEYTKNRWIIHFWKVSFMVCELYLNKSVIFFNKGNFHI